MKKLLYFVNDAPFLLSHRWPVVAAARDKGYEVHVLAPPDPDSEAFFAREGVTFHPIVLDRKSMGPIRELKTFLATVADFRAIRPDLVHLITIKPVIYGGIASRITNVPMQVAAVSGLGYLFIRQGLWAGLMQFFAKVAYNIALSHRHSKVIFQNPDDHDFFTRERIILPKEAVLIRGSGIDLAKFTPSPEPEGLSVRVMMVSRFLADKGLHEFVNAARVLKPQNLPVVFTLVGYVDPHNPASVDEEQIRAWQEEGIIENWGRRDDIAEVYRKSHIACLPSYREGLPKSLIEAAACGRPIVTTDVPGCREVVEHEKNGLLVPAGDAHALAEAIARLVGDKDMRSRMGEYSRKKAEAEFGIDSVVFATLTVYEGLSCQSA